MNVAWLSEFAIDDGTDQNQPNSNVVMASESSIVLRTARRELMQFVHHLVGQEQGNGASGHTLKVLVGTIDQAAFEGLFEESEWNGLPQDSYRIRMASQLDGRQLMVVGNSDVGTLYGVFHLRRLVTLHEPLESIDFLEQPQNPLRMVDHWDNLDGSIERGYAGESLFFANHQVIQDLTRVEAYARLLGSIGINRICLNNVNVHAVESRLITPEFLPDVARLADVFRAFGIRVFLSINFASPIEVGGLTTADPLHPGVQAWWDATAKTVYRLIPDFGGFVVKADSEFRPGPFTYGRNHVDGANMLARSVSGFGGLIIWRCFVYNCLQDWRDRTTDRAKAAYDHFTPLDGQFADNVLLQIKNGPMDFQVREPVSPLFGALEQTNQVLELQITQEYTGQQRHLCFLVPQWKKVVDFDTEAYGPGWSVADVVSGTKTGRPHGGFAAVSNVGDDPFWTGHPLAQANLYGFGRLAWNPRLASEDILREWTQLTFGDNPDVVMTTVDLLLRSWRVYEQYTAPLGVGWMVNPNHHYGPNVDGYEYSKWGTYHFADCKGIGVDRTMATGTGYTAQYRHPDLYESLETCPDELLLFFHHVPYTHRLKTGETVIQHIYDTHFAGADAAKQFVEAWKRLDHQIDVVCFERVLQRLEEQAAHAEEWRDQINTYFFRKSGIPDGLGRTIY